MASRLFQSHILSNDEPIQGELTVAVETNSKKKGGMTVKLISFSSTEILYGIWDGEGIFCKSQLKIQRTVAFST